MNSLKFMINRSTTIALHGSYRALSTSPTVSTAIKTISVVGSGLMGSGIAQVKTILVIACSILSASYMAP